MTRPVRVVLATRVFAPDSNAAAFRLAALVRALDLDGAEVAVVTVKPSRTARDSGELIPAKISRWPVLRDRGGNVRGYIQYLSYDVPLFSRLVWRRADVFVSEAPPTTGFVVAVASLLRRRPFVYYAADLFSDGVVAVGAPAFVATVMRFVEGWVLRRARAVLAVSEDVAGKIAAFGVPTSRIVNVGHGVDTDVFSPSVVPREPGYPYFVYTGTMSEVHRPHVFIEAFAKIAPEFPNVRLHFFGQGVYREALQVLADRLVPGRVHFSNIVPAAVAASWIRGAVAALVSLTPDVGYEYAHPTKAYAAAATGSPIIYAGPAEFGQIVTTAGLGSASSHDSASVAAAMRDALLAPSDDEGRLARSAWARENASLDQVARRGATTVLATRLTGSREDRLSADAEARTESTVSDAI